MEDAAALTQQLERSDALGIAEMRYRPCRNEEYMDSAPAVLAVGYFYFPFSMFRRLTPIFNRSSSAAIADLRRAATV